jgi:hypothetical protein
MIKLFLFKTQNNMSSHHLKFYNHMRKRIVKHLLERVRDKGFQKSFGDDFTIYLVDDTPRSIPKAFASPDADGWKETVHSEMDSIMMNETWEVVDHPFGCKPVGCKWVFKKKLMPHGIIEKYKARLVAKGYTQK